MSDPVRLRDAIEEYLRAGGAPITMPPLGAYGGPCDGSCKRSHTLAPPTWAQWRDGRAVVHVCEEPIRGTVIP